MSCSKTQHLVLERIELPLSGLIQQTTKKKNRYFFLITKKTGFDIHAMETICMKSYPVFLEE